MNKKCAYNIDFLLSATKKTYPDNYHLDQIFVTASRKVWIQLRN